MPGRLQASGAGGLAEVHDPETGAVALLGVGLGGEDAGNGDGSRGAGRLSRWVRNRQFSITLTRGAGVRRTVRRSTRE